MTVLKTDLLRPSDGSYSSEMYHRGYTHSVKEYSEDKNGNVVINEIYSCHKSLEQAEKGLKVPLSRRT